MCISWVLPFSPLKTPVIHSGESSDFRLFIYQHPDTLSIWTYFVSSPCIYPWESESHSRDTRFYLKLCDNEKNKNLAGTVPRCKELALLTWNPIVTFIRGPKSCMRTPSACCKDVVESHLCHCPVGGAVISTWNCAKIISWTFFWKSDPYV